VSALGDGMYLAALPLLAATLTRDPLPVAVVRVAGWLPWLLFALPAGALVDRLDRRRVMWSVDAGRALVVGALTVAVVAGWASIPLLAVAGFLVGAGAAAMACFGLATDPWLAGAAYAATGAVWACGTSPCCRCARRSSLTG
jgi:MFS family permease